MRRIVIKLGTGVLSRLGGRALDSAQFKRISSEVSALVAEGNSVILVSSAAIAAGVHVLGLDTRPGDLPGRQACAAAGQPELMRLYSKSFARHGLHVAQLLLSYSDIDSRTRHVNACNTIDRLLAAHNVVPIINENDSVAVDEIGLRFGDNDRLSAEVAQLVEADFLLLLTTSDGLQNGKRERIPVVRDIEDAFEHVRPDKGELSVGGMKTKLEAVRLALQAGIPSAILDGHKPGQIAAALKGGDAGTRFPIPRKIRKHQ